MAVSEVLTEQDALRAEAGGVYRDLRLEELLSDVGAPTIVGSAALGLMVRRDLDIDVACARLDDAAVAAVTAVGAQLGTHPRVRLVTFRNDCGVWNQEPDAYPDGLYLGVECRASSGATWNVDIWFLDQPERQPSTVHLTTVRPYLTDETRVAIIGIKRAWVDRPEYGKSVKSFDIYRAVLGRLVWIFAGARRQLRHLAALPNRANTTKYELRSGALRCTASDAAP
ncbi:hypothetical protein SAMN06297387_11610 [Streptomyces zhaozhouensis]|uniref:Uncharacterized protein n=1 Tax=Streptomyces zhaozhouensis TaxID=1300267 RepID=A0A286E047_9ACTN|nr:hypothetical protein [Streptomyces zhaozhouensis]SOD64286.1 hypothetical protein SAMN06297387_11610 [Streptomyces zhaozhouensis]